MRLTNNHNIPAEIYRKIKEDIVQSPYPKHDDCDHQFRVTELLGPPLKRTLWSKYLDSDELVVDASHFLTVMFGTAFHKLCEGDNTDNITYEQYVSGDFIVDGIKCHIDGKLDEIEFESLNVTITDNKTCLLSNMGYDKQDYYDQVNMYFALIRSHLPPDSIPKLQIRWFIKDMTATTKIKALARSGEHTKTYQNALLWPDSAIDYTQVAIETTGHMDALITARLKDHIDNPDRPCTFEERWDVKPRVAIMIRLKNGNSPKQARRVFDTAAQCQDWATANLSIEEVQRMYFEDRIPQDWERNKMCQYYCSSKSVCPYAKEMGYCK